MHLLLAVVVTMLLAPVTASAQVIHACVKNGGTIKIVADPAQCNAGDTPVAWNVQGAQGEPGLWVTSWATDRAVASREPGASSTAWVSRPWTGEDLRRAPEEDSFGRSAEPPLHRVASRPPTRP